jgi:hypothetical protein
MEEADAEQIAKLTSKPSDFVLHSGKTNIQGGINSIAANPTSEIQMIILCFYSLVFLSRSLSLFSLPRLNQHGKRFGTDSIESIAYRAQVRALVIQIS